MIVCICRNVSDRKIRETVKNGITTMPELRTELGVGTCCGKCHACAKTLLRECLEDGAREAQPAIFQGALAA